MNVLYGGRYRRRFERIAEVVGAEVDSVCELCFGDTIFAAWCRDREIAWTGIDLNPGFCARARSQGFRVLEGDVLEATLPRVDACVMIGSLYHFIDRLDALFDAVFASSCRFLVSEPVRNLSSRAGPVGWLARRSADPGDGRAMLRFDEPGLRSAFDEQAGRLGLCLEIHSVDRDLLAELSR